MKKLFLLICMAIIVWLVVACKEAEVNPQDSKIGCMTGIHNGNRELIWCCTHEQFLAGDNVGAGGNARASFFTDWQWAKCAECK